MDTTIVSVNKPSSVVVQQTYNVCHSIQLPSKFVNKNHNKYYNTKIKGDAVEDHAINILHLYCTRLVCRNCIGQNFAFNEMKVVLSRLLQRYALAFTSPDNNLQAST